MTFHEIRIRANRLRQIPLETVLLHSGAERDPLDKHKWHTREGVLSVTGMKFINWNSGFGGGGAIDLVMHLNHCDFKHALQWLGERFPDFSPREHPTPEPRPRLSLPPPDAAMLSHVSHYLIQDRGLAPSIIEPLIASETLYADARANAVFVMLGVNNKPVGAELRGTGDCPWRGMAPGSRKDRGYFSIPNPHAEAIVLCESAIDAISCYAIHPHCFCISTSGARSDPAWLPHLIDQGYSLFCGFDADIVGDKMAATMIDLHPTIKRLRPPLHDWNDVLNATQ